MAASQTIATTVTLWEPMSVFAFRPFSVRDDITCMGTVIKIPHHKCNKPIHETIRDEAVTLLAGMARQPPDVYIDSPELGDLAILLLCRHKDPLKSHNTRGGTNFRNAVSTFNRKLRGYCARRDRDECVREREAREREATKKARDAMEKERQAENERKRRRVAAAKEEHEALEEEEVRQRMEASNSENEAWPAPSTSPALVATQQATTPAPPATTPDDTLLILIVHARNTVVAARAIGPCTSHTTKSSARKWSTCAKTGFTVAFVLCALIVIFCWPKGTQAAWRQSVPRYGWLQREAVV
ncbi:hypothetical protein LTR36_010155 [Oleoguttula mirabilis]|uniref:Uncharacterized protein n=1 Tax=Oleoguttula mirabilis TaxID=1507867 RepID=A0AAV9JS20_9PEZI|nr:hypothetical protein LTR36_010155 [Oleoguttula mirabilis]